MVTTITKSGANMEPSRRTSFKVTIFHCANALGKYKVPGRSDVDFHVVAMPCSGMTREVHLLRAFEAGADAVIVFACPEGQCHYLEGNIRAGKRVARVRKILDEIGLNGGRLNIYRIQPQDENAVRDIVDRKVAGLDILGPNPAA